ncbi:hypothetical protein QZH41_014839 [Actinostola sp. cb2023]|nr:hypothetical protein QZH41_014839 [Actinostola sp. cb2023]
MYWRRRQRHEFHCVGKVSGLFIYPVKSCKGIPVDCAMCFDQGLQHDRRWIILNEKDRFISARERPALALVKPSIIAANNGLCLDAPNMETLEVALPLNTTEFKSISVFGVVGEGQSAGQEAAAWLSKYLNKPGCKLYYMTKPRFIANDEIWGDVAKPDDKHGFGDFAPLLVTTTEALAALNNELDTPITMARFRPNVIINGTKTFDEDNWKQLKVNDVEIRCMKNCDRCVMTTIDPDLGVKTGKEPLATLKRTRLPENRDKRFGDSPFFGIHAAVDKEGVIKVGDTVFARE